VKAPFSPLQQFQKFLPLEATATLPAAALSTDYYEYYNNNGKLLYLVKEVAGNDVVVINSDAQGNNYYFLFERSAKNEVEGIKYLGSDGNSSHQIYFKTLAQGGVDTFTVQYFDAVKDAKAIAAIKAQLEDIFTYFNFVWEAKGLLLDGHFTQKLNSFYAIDSVDVHLYTGATITVPEPEVEIPQTGDAATTIGFVMVAMAIVAAAAVAYKKVRA